MWRPAAVYTCVHTYVLHLWIASASSAARLVWAHTLPQFKPNADTVQTTLSFQRVPTGSCCCPTAVLLHATSQGCTCTPLQGCSHESSANHEAHLQAGMAPSCPSCPLLQIGHLPGHHPCRQQLRLRSLHHGGWHCWQTGLPAAQPGSASRCCCSGWRHHRPSQCPEAAAAPAAADSRLCFLGVLHAVLL